ncbi:MAG: MotA/TolQ/ExbB proton channel family protein [Bdellovibrionota bacterium]
MNALIVATDLLEKIILLILIGLSIWSISIIIDRRKLFKKEFQNDLFDLLQKKLSEVKDKKNLLQELQGDLFLSRAIVKSLSQSSNSETFEKSLAGVIKTERIQFEKGLSVLATLGANAPFIGLFGTVLGIIRAFAFLGTQSGSSAVMSGVSQALYATAMGLLVAIPAVIANNYFSHHLRVAIQKIEALRDELLARKIVE